MGRNDYHYETTTCAAGINQQAELARKDQCEDALNVWAPSGRVEQRPGYQGAATFYSDLNDTLTSPVFISETPIGTFTTTGTLSSLPVDSRWYFGFTAVTTAAAAASGIGLRVATSSTNSNEAWAKVEYWNGSEWAVLRTLEGVNYIRSSTHLSGALQDIYFPWPADMAQTTVNSLTRYFFRFTPKSVNGSTALDSSTVVTAVALKCTNDGAEVWRPAAIFAAQFPYSKRYITLFFLAGDQSQYVNSAELGIKVNSTDGAAGPVISRAMPASSAVIPQFGEAYLAHDGYVTYHKEDPTSQTSAALLRAAVEDDSAIVGSGAPYDVAEIAQLTEWPKSKLIAFFRNEFWAANLDDSGDYTVRWSAPSPNYKVWPSLNVEVLMEDDNSPITGLKGFDQHMVVFKNDSMWRMVDTGISDFGLQTYAPERVVAGVGCVSNTSIQQVEGQLVFQAEDGIYGFDGATARKVTVDPKTGADRLKDTIARITPGRRPFSTAVLWKKHSMYLLAVSVDGSDANNLVIAWDYKNDTWWQWNNIQAQFWLSDEDAADNERLYFVDFAGRIYELGVGDTDHGATINSYVKTHRFAWGGQKKRVRAVEVTSTNKTRSLTVELIGNDEATGTSGTLTLTDTAEKEYGTSSSSTTAVYSTDYYTPNRRRMRRLMFNKGVDWAQVKVSHSTKNTPMAFSDISLGLVPLGRR